MTRVLALLLGAATVVALLDLAHKAYAISERGSAVLHDRPTLYVLAGGVVLGGAAGNLLSFALWPSLSGVPDPILAGGLAFSLGDVAVVIGFSLLIPALVVFRVRRRAGLAEPA
jgi:hypothetical protein